MESKKILNPNELKDMNEYERNCVKAALNLQFYDQMDVKKMKDGIMNDINRGILKNIPDRADVATTSRQITERTSIKQNSAWDINSQHIKIRIPEKILN